jgi:hypothetical protein
MRTNFSFITFSFSLDLFGIRHKKGEYRISNVQYRFLSVEMINGVLE